MNFLYFVLTFQMFLYVLMFCRIVKGWTKKSIEQSEARKEGRRSQCPNVHVIPILVICLHIWYQLTISPMRAQNVLNFTSSATDSPRTRRKGSTHGLRGQ